MAEHSTWMLLLTYTLHLYNWYYFVLTTYRKMMLLSTWNRTNPCITAWGRARNLNVLNGSIPIKTLKNTEIES